jgi:hypothetical protein
MIWVSAGGGESYEGFACSARLYLSTPSLLVVNKQVSSEIHDVLAPCFNLLTKSTLLGQPNESIDSGFLSLVEDGRFVFFGGCGFALSFFNNILPSTLSAIRSIVFTDDLLFRNIPPTKTTDAWGMGWSTSRPTPGPFAEVLRSHLQKCREIALFVPLDDEPRYCYRAPLEIASLLQEGLIDVMHMLFTEYIDHSFKLSSYQYTPGMIWVETALYRAIGPKRLFSIPVHEDFISDPLDMNGLYGWAKGKTAFSVRRSDEESIVATSLLRDDPVENIFGGVASADFLVNLSALGLGLDSA